MEEVVGPDAAGAGGIRGAALELPSSGPAKEIFGHVAPIITFTSEDEAVRLANDTEYGLVAYVYTKDLNRSPRMGERLETGMLGLNAGVVSNEAAPFGGVKQSGLGHEGGLEGIEEYLYTQYIGINDPYAP